MKSSTSWKGFYVLGVFDFLPLVASIKPTAFAAQKILNGQNVQKALAWSGRPWHKNLAKILIWPRSVRQTVDTISSSVGRSAFKVT